ncbi:hypothetical protein EOM09_01350 [bacterium]|nr:hypothetical protein [bacterium]
MSILQPMQITRDADAPIASTSRLWLQEYFDRESSIFIRIQDDEDEVEVGQYNNIIKLLIKI